MFIAAAALAAITFLGAPPRRCPAADVRPGLRHRGGGARVAGDPARSGRPLAAPAGGRAQRAEHERGPRGGAGDRRARGRGGRRGLGVRAQRGVVRRHRGRDRQWRAPGAHRHRPAGTAGRGAALGRALRAQRADRPAAAVPGRAVHPRRERGVGAAARGRGERLGLGSGGLRAAAGHGRDRRGRRSVGHPAGAGAGRVGAAGHRRDGGHRGRRSPWSPRSATRCVVGAALLPVGGRVDRGDVEPELGPAAGAAELGAGPRAGLLPGGVPGRAGAGRGGLGHGGRRTRR